MKTYLDWSAYQDAGMGDAYADIPRHGENYAKAVAACINSRQCEAEGKQVMCPSYRASGNPALSTGGRVRALKLALNEDDPDRALADPELAQAMDLCVSCKGCKRECEANVDMALIKVEYLAQRRAREGLTLRSRLFARIPELLHRHHWLRGLIRWRNRTPWIARLGERWLGLRADVPLPEPAARPFDASALPPSTESTAGTPGERPEVVLFVDTFGRYFEPEIPQAALEVLQAGGYRVHIATPLETDADPCRPLCCGRTYLGQGMVEEARAEARRLRDALLPHVEAGRVVVGFEASCILGLRDDALALGLGPDMQRVAEHTLLFEEFLAREIMARRLELPLHALADGETLVQGHCHQKAVGAMKAMRRVLKLIPGHRFEMIDAGCCGMAGTFGLEAEHARMSDDLAEAALMPALREHPQARVVANGFSCRQQMHVHGDDRARHLALLLRDALVRE